MGKPIRDVESGRDNPRSFDAREREEWSPFEGPCPYCGGEEFLERAEQEQVVSLTDEGDQLVGDPIAQPKTLEVWCRGCDTCIWNADRHD